MDVGDLRSLYLRELQELCAFEAEMVGALPRMAISAGSVELRRAIRRLAEQTVLHEQRAEAILRRHGSGRQADADQIAIALVKKAEQIMCGVADPDLRDAALVASVRRIEHHQIAAYSAADGYAEALFLEIDRHSLLATLQEEKITDRRLESLQSDINRLAILVSTPPY
jgi:ferritin-like metal-binding protein YciE